MNSEELLVIEMTRDEATELLNHLSGASDASDETFEHFYEVLENYVDGPIGEEVDVAE